MSAPLARKKQGKGKKHRKFGRWLRAPAMKRYVGENRWAINKAKRIARHLRRMGHGSVGR